MGNQEKKPVAIKPLVKEGLKLLRASIPTTIEIRSDIESDPAIMAAAMSVTPHPNSAALQRK